MLQKRMAGSARRDKGRGMRSTMMSADEPMRAVPRGKGATIGASKPMTRTSSSGRGRSLQGRAAAPRMSSAKRSLGSEARPAKKAPGRKAATRKSTRKRARSR
jgi:hypothetical protein